MIETLTTDNLIPSEKQTIMENSVIVRKLNELIDEYNKLEKEYKEHIHYAREMQYPTSTPDNPNVWQ